MASNPATHIQAQSTVNLPRVEIKFCVKCKWNLRAAYYAQELLQTFSETIGEIALVPVTGGIFTITLTHASPVTNTSTEGISSVTDKPVTTSPPAEPELLDETTELSHGNGSAREKGRLSSNSSITTSLSHVGQGPIPLSLPAPSPITAPAITPVPKPTAAHQGPDTNTQTGVQVQVTQIWDRKVDGGFPETKALKDRVRNVIDPGRGLGHIDRVLGKDKEKKKEDAVEEKKTTAVEEEKMKDHGHEKGGKEDCVECRDAARES